MMPALLKTPDLDCAAVQIEDKGTHGFRRDFITYARADGASPDVLERITHNRRGEIIDVHTSFEWPTLCRAVRCLKVNLERGTLLTADYIESFAEWTHFVRLTYHQRQAYSTVQRHRGLLGDTPGAI